MLEMLQFMERQKNILTSQQTEDVFTFEGYECECQIYLEEKTVQFRSDDI